MERGIVSSSQVSGQRAQYNQNVPGQGLNRTVQSGGERNNRDASETVDTAISAIFSE